MPLVVFRVDASIEMGGGHIMRCQTLASILTDKGWECLFISIVGSQEFVSSEIELVEIQPENSTNPVILKKLIPNGCDLLVIDNYNIGAEYESRCKNWAKKIFVIDDINNRKHECDIFLNQNTGWDAGDYQNLNSEDSLILVGPNYALINPVYRELRELTATKRLITKSPQTILITFGSRPPAEIIKNSVKGIELSKINWHKVHVVIAEMNDYFDILKNNSKLDIEFHLQPKNLAHLMSQVDVAISNGGSTSWERCCLGLPSISIIMAENQRKISQSLDHFEAVISLEQEALKAIDIAEALNKISQSEIYSKYSNNAFNICDGLGVRRIELAINPSYTKKNEPISLRPAISSDCEVIYGWQLEPGSRQYFNNPKVPTYCEHSKWMKEQLSDKHSLFNIILINNIPAGFLLLKHDQKQKDYNINILITLENRKKGIASASLLTAKKLLPDAKLRAKIHRNNKESLALFRNSGFKAIGNNWYGYSPNIGS